MTVSYKKSGKDGGSYYTNQSSEVDDYYTYGDKEPPGVWYVAPNSFGERKTGPSVFRMVSRLEGWIPKNLLH